ncbi:hypothetical protein PGQ11_010927 [Apiospora arundinis]|uniref:Uncharacterized protein n=1 Tax=Apiospora arundinis TaxID=335852 RepID=A0ABR2HY01_9PEZI
MRSIKTCLGISKQILTLAQNPELLILKLDQTRQIIAHRQAHPSKLQSPVLKMRCCAITGHLILFASLAAANLVRHHNFLPTLTASGRAPLTTSTGSKCGKGYTYCGYMLQSDGHNFSPQTINKTYCDGLKDYCPNNTPKTSPNQAVFICMDDAPVSIQLMCACSGKCLDEPASNNIAHCDSACASPSKC